MIRKIIFFFLIFILLVNIVAYSVALYFMSPHDGLIIKIKPLHTVFIFAHGAYEGKTHYTWLNHWHYETRQIIEGFEKAGYTHIWISMCEQGDREYMNLYDNGTMVIWPTTVSRVTEPGNIYPVYLGFTIYRVVV